MAASNNLPMEINLVIYCTEIDILINYYVTSLGVFKIEYKELDEVRLLFVHDERIKLLLRQNNDNRCPQEILLQVPNAEILFDFVEKQNLKDSGIVEGAYKFENQEITFLTAPPGNYFHTKDPNGNKIIFFDKYEERG